MLKCWECTKGVIKSVRFTLAFRMSLVHIERSGPSRFTVAHDDVIKWKHFPRYLPFVRGIHRSPVNPPHKGQWRGALMFTLICARINGWVNNCEAGDLRRNRAHYDVIVMVLDVTSWHVCVFRFTDPLQGESKCPTMHWCVVFVSLCKLLNIKSSWQIFETPCRPCDVIAVACNFWIRV